MRVYNARDVPNMEIAERNNAGIALSPVRGGESKAAMSSWRGEWMGVAARKYMPKSYIYVVIDK